MSVMQEDSSHSQNVTQLEEELRQLVAEIGEIAPAFDSQANFYLDLGVPSMKAMQLLMQLEDKYGVQVPDDQFVEATSLKSLTAMMAQLQTGKAAG